MSFGDNAARQGGKARAPPRLPPPPPPRERERPRRRSSASHSSSDGCEDAGERDCLVPQQQQFAGMRVTHREAVTNEQLIAERGQAIEEIEEDVGEIFGMMQRMDMMVGDQGEQLDEAADHLERGRDHVTSGREQLIEADMRAQRGRRRQCWIIACVAVALVLIVLWGTRQF